MSRGQVGAWPNWLWQFFYITFSNLTISPMFVIVVDVAPRRWQSRGLAVFVLNQGFPTGGEFPPGGE